MSRYSLSRIDRVAQMSAQEEIIARKKLEILEKQKTAELAKQVVAAQAAANKPTKKEKAATNTANAARASSTSIAASTEASSSSSVGGVGGLPKNSFNNDGSFFENFKKITDAAKKAQQEKEAKLNAPAIPILTTLSQAQAQFQPTDLTDGHTDGNELEMKLDPTFITDLHPAAAVVLCANPAPPPPPPPPPTTSSSDADAEQPSSNNDDTFYDDEYGEQSQSQPPVETKALTQYTGLVPTHSSDDCDIPGLGLSDPVPAMSHSTISEQPDGPSTTATQDAVQSDLPQPPLPPAPEQHQSQFQHQEKPEPPCSFQSQFLPDLHHHNPGPVQHQQQQLHFGAQHQRQNLAPVQQHFAPTDYDARMQPPGSQAGPSSGGNNNGNYVNPFAAQQNRPMPYISHLHGGGNQPMQFTSHLNPFAGRPTPMSTATLQQQQQHMQHFAGPPPPFMQQTPAAAFHHHQQMQQNQIHNMQQALQQQHQQQQQHFMPPMMHSLPPPLSSAPPAPAASSQPSPTHQQTTTAPQQHDQPAAVIPTSEAAAENPDESKMPENQQDISRDHEFIPTSVESLVELVAENGDEYEDRLRSRKIDMHSSLWFLCDTNSRAYRNYRKKVLALRYNTGTDDDEDDEDRADGGRRDGRDTDAAGRPGPEAGRAAGARRQGGGERDRGGESSCSSGGGDGRGAGALTTAAINPSAGRSFHASNPAAIGQQLTKENNDDDKYDPADMMYEDDDDDEDDDNNDNENDNNTVNEPHKNQQANNAAIAAHIDDDDDDGNDSDSEFVRAQRAHNFGQQLKRKQEDIDERQLYGRGFAASGSTSVADVQAAGSSVDMSTAAAGPSKKRSRWGESSQQQQQNNRKTTNPFAGPSPAAAVAVAALAAGSSSAGTTKLTQCTRTNPALLAYARQSYGTTDLDDETWRKCEDHFKVNLLYQDMLRKRNEMDRLARSGRQKYEYDSDEDVQGGTWEHKARTAEMEATAVWSDALTKQAEGKHHIGDFLPPEELRKFMEKYDSQQTNREPDLSDYREYKLREDNKGFQMLQKLGWKEGQGLGFDGAGIVDPVNKAQQRDNNQGLGTIEAANPDFGDNEYDAYRKRMMLAYRFRPNPLNNPRRSYY